MTIALSTRSRCDECGGLAMVECGDAFLCEHGDQAINGAVENSDSSAPPDEYAVTAQTPAPVPGAVTATISSSCKICSGAAEHDFGKGVLLCGPCAANVFDRSVLNQNSRGVIPVELAVHFLSKVGDLNSNGCRLWLGKIGTGGYGQFPVDGEMIGAPRAGWKILVGPLTREQHALHKCDIRACVNLDHLFIGTNLENIADMDRKGRRHKIVEPTNAKLSDEQVTAALSRYAAGEEIAALAKELDVRLPTISAIVHGRTWKHIPRPDGFVIRERRGALPVKSASAPTSSCGSTMRPCQPGGSFETIGTRAGNPLTEQGDPRPQDSLSIPIDTPRSENCAPVTDVSAGAPFSSVDPELEAAICVLEAHWLLFGLDLSDDERFAKKATTSRMRALSDISANLAQPASSPTS